MINPILRKSLFVPLVLTLCLASLLPLRTVRGSTTINVSDGAVAIAADGTCSLLEAIENAQDTVSGSVHADCTAGDPAAEDTIELASNGLYMFDADSAEFPITGNVAIIGNAATLDHGTAGFFDLATSSHLKLRNLTITGSDGFRSAISGSGSLTLRNTTFTENVRVTGTGEINAHGAAINLFLNSGILTINNAIFTNNVANSNGGAIYVSGNLNTVADAVTITNSHFEGNGQWIGAPGITSTFGGALHINITGGTTEHLNISDSTFIDNVADWGGAIRLDGAKGTIASSEFEDNTSLVGGAIYSTSGADYKIEQSLFRRNSSGNGGGLANRSASVVISNSTFSGNEASAGTAIYNSSLAGDSAASSISVDFSTITNNTSTSTGSLGAAVYNLDNGAGLGGSIWLQNSIVFSNSNQTGSGFDCASSGGVITSLGYNMGDDDANADCPFTESTDREAAGAATDHLMALDDNDGPTRTHALTATSTAKNKIPLGSSGCEADTLDQRGFLRASGNGVRCDIGAYELGADMVPTAVGMGGVSATSSGSGQAEITLSPYQLLLTLLGLTAIALATNRFSKRSDK